MSLNQRIKGILKEHRISQASVAEVLGVTDSAVNQLLNNIKEVDSLAFISAVAKLTGKPAREVLGENFDSFFDGLTFTEDNPDGLEKYEKTAQFHRETLKAHDESVEYLRGEKIRVVTATVDKHGRDMMVFVPVRSYAGYLTGYAQPEFIEKLPAFNLPILKSGQYRMFENSGDSMKQLGGGGLSDGDIVIGQYVEDIFDMKDNRIYVVVSTEGINTKRCLNRLKEVENPLLVMKSDNTSGPYPDIILRAHQIIEIWELKAFISKQMGFATDLWKLIGDLEVKMATMNEKIERLSNERLPG